MQLTVINSDKGEASEGGGYVHAVADRGLLQAQGALGGAERGGAVWEVGVELEFAGEVISRRNRGIAQKFLV